MYVCVHVSVCVRVFDWSLVKQNKAHACSVCLAATLAAYLTPDKLSEARVAGGISKLLIRFPSLHTNMPSLLQTAPLNGTWDGPP